MVVCGEVKGGLAVVWGFNLRGMPQPVYGAVWGIGVKLEHGQPGLRPLADSGAELGQHEWVGLEENGGQEAKSRI